MAVRLPQTNVVLVVFWLERRIDFARDAKQLVRELYSRLGTNHRLRHSPLGIKVVAFGKLTAVRVLAEMTLYSRRVPLMMGGST